MYICGSGKSGTCTVNRNDPDAHHVTTHTLTTSVSRVLQR